MRIFVPPKEIEKQKGIRLSADKSHHLITVFRCKQGNAITVIDGKGRAYEAEVSRIVKKDVFINIIRETSTDVESPLNLILCQGILKGEKMDIVVQKTTELGIKEIIPVITERAVVRDTRRLKRWRKIAEESVEQCGRTIIPVIHEPIYFEDFFKCRQSSVMDQKLNGLIFWEEGGLSLSKVIRKIVIQDSPIHIFIGTEGGFTSGEVKIAEEKGLIRTTLGRRILRAETAAIVSVALVQFLSEN